MRQYKVYFYIDHWNIFRLPILHTILAISFTSCKQEKKEDVKPTQMEQVMAIHDEVMPKMSTINSLIEKLNAKVDTTEIGLKYEKAKAARVARNDSTWNAAILSAQG